jgi:hypothetical protein
MLMNQAKKNYKLELTLDEVKSLIYSSCFYCGQEPSLRVVLKRRIDNRISEVCVLRNGIDRKNSSLNYTKENCVPCCHICNRAKMAMPYGDFIKYIDNLTRYRNSVITSACRSLASRRHSLKNTSNS